MNTQDYHLLKAMTGWQPVELIDSPLPVAPKGSLESLKEVLHHLDGIHTVTLDIFDTLLRRDVEPCDHTKRVAMQQLSLVMAQADIEINVDELLNLRTKAESQAKQNALTLGGDAECTLSEIFIQLYQLIESCFQFKPEPLLPYLQLVEFEVQVEIERLSPMPYSKQLLQALKKKNITIILLSDMYLEEEHIRKILRHHDLYDCIDGLYVSSSTRLSKGSGSLFKYLISEGKLLPEYTLHIGDHQVSDYQRPRQHGIHALLLHSNVELRRRSTLQQIIRLANRCGDTNHLWNHCNTSAPKLDTPSPYQIGYQRLGPIFTLFALDVLTKALQTPYREVFFLARDSYLLQQLYTRLREKLQLSRLLPSPAGRYLYLSRASTRLMSLSGKHDELVALAQRVNKQDGVWSLIAILGLDRKSYEPLVNDILQSNGPQDTLEQSAILQHRLLETPAFMEKLQKDMTESTQRLENYLTQETFFDEGNILLVDIGWNGSILSTLEKAFGDLPSFPQIDARFFGRLYGEALDKINLAPGFAYDINRRNPLEHLINECRELFETTTSSMEGSVLGYLTTPNGIVPRCAKSTLSDADRALITQIQEGILAYCDDFAQMYNRFTPTPESLHYDAILQATSLITGTHPDEQTVIGDLKFELSWDTGGLVNIREYLGFNKRNLSSSPTHTQSALKVSLSDSGAQTHDLQKVFENIHHMVERLKQEDRLIFYGVGTISSLIAPLLIDRIVYFVDGNSALQGETFLGKPIHSPNILSEESEHCLFVTPIGRKNIIGKSIADCSLPTLFMDDFI